MDNKQFRRSISDACRRVMKKQGFIHADVDINHVYSYVSIGKNGHHFFSQGEDAGNLIEEATNASNKSGLALSTCMVWLLDSAGVFGY